ncbi:hypothetical protein FDB28_05715 [Clostridium botulinum]|nr:hypothetical protein [Clostridium botulinum]NFS95358.1 hypothetical protein [Clostridium botulinum]
MNESDKSLVLTNTLKELAYCTHLDQDNLNRYSNIFKTVYENKFRHEYSEVTRVLFSIKDENRDARDFLPEKIKNIRDNIKKEQCNGDILESLDKLWDHINLENIRMTELENIAESVNKASEEAKNNYEKARKIDGEIEKINKTVKSLNSKTNNFNNDMKKYNINLNESKNKLSSLQRNMKNSTTESITILSIFAGVVMAFTGGFSYISQALVSLNAIGPYRAAAFILLIGIVMFDVIFLLLYMIGKLTERYIGSKGKCNNLEQGCKNKSVACSANRYPYVVWFNLISSIVIVTIVNLYCIDRYNLLSRIYNFVFTNFKWSKLLLYLVLLLFIITYVPFGILIYKIRKNECKSKQ